VRVIVPFAPGGGGDITARQVSQKLTEQLGQQFVVDNCAGAGEKFDKRIRGDYERWVRVVREAGIKVQ